MGFEETRNLTMLMDLHEMFLANSYFNHEFGNQTAIFDVFFNKIPDNGGFAVFAGLEQIINSLNNLKFTSTDIEYLREKKLFSEEFLLYLANYKFKCDVWAMKEGTPVFPGEPILTVRGPMIQAQLLETLILNTINFSSLIATKTNRIVRSAQSRQVIEYGARHAHGTDGAVLGARAAYIGGCEYTSCMMAEEKYQIPSLGLMEHSFVLAAESEYEAFEIYAKTYPDDLILLIDTYDVLKSGLPNAVKIFNEIIRPLGKRPLGVRICSGDLGYVSKKVRAVLDQSGFEDVKIFASNALDEYIIRDLFLQGAKVDVFAVGANLITSKSSPVFGAGYKMSAVVKNGIVIPKIKLNESAAKVYAPHFKQVYRLVSNECGMCVADLVALRDEEIRTEKGITIFDPNATWKKKYLTNITAVEMLVPIFKAGECVYKSPKIHEIRTYCAEQIESLWDEVKRFEFPHEYYVDLSFKLWDIRNMLISDYQAYISD